MFLYGAVQHMFAVPSICSEDLFCERNPPNRCFAYSRSNSSALSEAFETHVQLYNCGFLFAENTLLVLIWAKRLWDIYILSKLWAVWFSLQGTPTTVTPCSSISGPLSRSSTPPEPLQELGQAVQNQIDDRRMEPIQPVELFPDRPHFEDVEMAMPFLQPAVPDVFLQPAVPDAFPQPAVPDAFPQPAVHPQPGDPHAFPQGSFEFGLGPCALPVVFGVPATLPYLEMDGVDVPAAPTTSLAER